MDGPAPIEASMHSLYRLSIETLENGYAVEVPDMEEIAKKRAEAKKLKQPEPYSGGSVKKYAAKTVKEVLAIVKSSLEQLPEGEYDAAFNEAAKKHD